MNNSEGNRQVEAVTNNTAIRWISVSMQLLGAPVIVALIIYQLQTSAAHSKTVDDRIADLTARVGRVEDKITDRISDVYPRPEAAQAFINVNSQLNAVQTEIQGLTHRIGNLEEARARGNGR